MSLCSPAYGVELRDVAWQAGTLNVAVDAAPGAVTEARFATVPAGGNVTHTYGIVVKARNSHTRLSFARCCALLF